MYILPENLLYFAPIKFSRKNLKKSDRHSASENKNHGRFIFKVKKLENN